MTKPHLTFRFDPKKRGINFVDEAAALAALAKYQAEAADYALTGRVPHAPAIPVRRGKAEVSYCPKAVTFIDPDISRVVFSVLLVEYLDRKSPKQGRAYRVIGDVIVQAERPSIPEGPYDHGE